VITFIRTHSVNYQSALDILRVRMNIILLSLDFSYIFILQGSVETQLRCGEIYNNHIIATCPQSVPANEFWKSVKNWQRYRQK